MNVEQLVIEIASYKRYSVSPVRDTIWTVDTLDIPLRGLSEKNIRKFLDSLDEQEDPVLVKALKAELQFRHIKIWRKIYQLRNLATQQGV